MYVCVCVCVCVCVYIYIIQIRKVRTDSIHMLSNLSDTTYKRTALFDVVAEAL